MGGGATLKAGKSLGRVGRKKAEARGPQGRRLSGYVARENWAAQARHGGMGNEQRINWQRCGGAQRKREGKLSAAWRAFV